jgi:hypothetical protein
MIGYTNLGTALILEWLKSQSARILDLLRPFMARSCRTCAVTASCGDLLLEALFRVPV